MDGSKNSKTNRSNPIIRSGLCLPWLIADNRSERSRCASRLLNADTGPNRRDGCRRRREPSSAMASSRKRATHTGFLLPTFKSQPLCHRGRATVSVSAFPVARLVSAGGIVRAEDSLCKGRKMRMRNPPASPVKTRYAPPFSNRFLSKALRLTRRKPRRFFNICRRFFSANPAVSHPIHSQTFRLPFSECSECPEQTDGLPAARALR